jgi:tetratricopeptide (TPR) repeat protein
MSRTVKGAILVFFAAIAIAAGIKYGRQYMREGITWETILRRIRQLSPSATPQPLGPNGSDPLTNLRPHPWSSPLHDRHFDEAIAGARAAADAEDYDRAIALNTEALNIHPSDDLKWVLLIRRADCYYWKGDPDKTIADLNEALRLGGLNADSYVTRAYALRQKGKTNEAMEDLEAAIRLNPNYAYPYCTRANIFVEDGNLYDAVADYAKALQLNPKAVDCRLSCAEIYVRENKSEEALNQADMVIRMNMRLSRAHIVKAEAYAKMRNFSKALAELDQVKQVGTKELPEALNGVAWFRATRPESELRDGKKALADSKKACELNHWKFWGYIDTLAAACAEVGDFDQALKYEKQALQTMPPGKTTDDANNRLSMYSQHKAFRSEL